MPNTHKQDSQEVVKTVQVQSHGKVILAGENFVAFGGTAIVCGIDLYSRCIATQWNESFCRIQIGFEVYEFDKESCLQAYLVALTFCKKRDFQTLAGLNAQRTVFWVRSILGQLLVEGIHFPNFCACIQLGAPLGSGLGGSATITSLLVRTAARLAERRIPGDQLYRLCASGDMIAHGGGTGTDSAGIVFAGFLAWNRCIGLRRLKVPMPIQFILCDSRQTKSSSTSLERLRVLQAQKTSKFDDIMRQLRGISREVEQALKAGPDLSWLGSLMVQNQELLRLTGVSTPEIDEIVRVSLEAGALGAKVTGGGCGGFVLILALPECLEQVVTALHAVQKSAFCVKTKDASPVTTLDYERRRDSQLNL